MIRMCKEIRLIDRRFKNMDAAHLLVFAQPHDGRIEKYVFPAGEFRVEPRTQLQHGSHHIGKGSLAGHEKAVARHPQQNGDPQPDGIIWPIRHDTVKHRIAGKTPNTAMGFMRNRI